MPNTTPPKRLTWPLSANQLVILDQMVEELYRRIGFLERLVAANAILAAEGETGLPGGPSGNVGITSLSEVIDVSQVDGLIGELASFPGPRGPIGQTGAAGARGVMGPPGLDSDDPSSELLAEIMSFQRPGIIAATGSGGLTAAQIPPLGYWSPLTNGDITVPELVFAAGDTVAVWTWTP